MTLKEKLSLSKYMFAEGIIVGDSHIGNNSVYTTIDSKGRIDLKYLNIDFDDGGRGPFAADIARLISTTKAIHDDHVTSDMLEAYIKGLQQHKISAPKKIKDLLNMPLQEYEQVNEDFINKFVSGDGKQKHFILDKKSIVMYNGELSYETLAELLPAGAKLMDIALRLKNNKESNYDRIWVLYKTKRGLLSILEVKPAEEPAIELFQTQKNIEERVEELFQVFWRDTPRESYQLAELLPGKYYWIRPKKVPLIDIAYKSDADKDVKFIKNKAIYDANLLGLAHGSQESSHAYINLILENPEAFKAALKEFNKSYLDLAKKAFGEGT